MYKFWAAFPCMVLEGGDNWLCKQAGELAVPAQGQMLHVYCTHQCRLQSLCPVATPQSCCPPVPPPRYTTRPLAPLQPALLKGTVLPLLHRISAGGNEGPRRPVATVVRALAMTGALDPAARDAWAETVLGWARHAAGEPSGEADAATLRRSARACQPFTLALESES